MGQFNIVEIRAGRVALYIEVAQTPRTHSNFDVEPASVAATAGSLRSPPQFHLKRGYVASVDYFVPLSTMQYLRRVIVT